MLERTCGLVKSVPKALPRLWESALRYTGQLRKVRQVRHECDWTGLSDARHHSHAAAHSSSQPDANISTKAAALLRVCCYPSTFFYQLFTNCCSAINYKSADYKRLKTAHQPPRRTALDHRQLDQLIQKQKLTVHFIAMSDSRRSVTVGEEHVTHADCSTQKKRRLNTVKCDRCRLDKQRVYIRPQHLLSGS
jgi:hypothetical protein